MTEIVVVLTTVPAVFDAPALARALVDAHVAACVSILPSVRSIYRWEGSVHDDEERQLLIKTTRESLGALWDALRSRHPYDVPEFLALPVVEGNPAYLAWIGGQVGQ